MRWPSWLSAKDTGPRVAGIPAAARLPRDARTQRIASVALGTDWTREFTLWGGSKIVLNIASAPIDVQLSRSNPPDPPVWDDPIPIAVGFWSHVGPFGYLRMRNQNPGGGGANTATVNGAMYAE